MTRLAGTRAVHQRGELPRRQRVVLVSTSGGLKNIVALADRMPMPRQVEPVEGAVRDLLRNGFAPAQAGRLRIGALLADPEQPVQ